MNNKTSKRGVTLVEIAIVLVIIGLLLGGVLKGQELINNAKVRSIADRQSSLKVAWFSFIDRFQGLPGDYVNAAVYIPGAATTTDITTLGDGVILEVESPAVLQNLTGTGYLRCPQCTSKASESPTATNSLQNQYGGVMAIFHNDTDYATLGGPNGRPRLYVHTGPGLPSNIIAEVDRKLDDGISNTGDMVFSQYLTTGLAGGIAPDPTLCMSAVQSPIILADAFGGTLAGTVPQAWRGATAVPAIENNCGGSVSI